MNEQGQGAIGGAGQGASSGYQVAGPWGAVIGGGLGAMAGLSAGGAAQAARIAEANARLDAMAQIGAIDLPTYQQRKLYLQRLERGEQLTPEMVQELQQGDTELAKFKEDQGLKNTQLDALAALKNKARMGGLDLNDRAALIEASREGDRANQGQQGAIQQNMAARGLSGGGQELAMRMAAAQNNAQQASQNSLNVAAQARAAALNALKESANQARGIAADDYSRFSNRAGAQDQINANNMRNAQAMKQYNVSARNNAQQTNINRANDVSDRNVAISNDEQVRNKNLLMQDYNDRINRVKDLNGLAGQNAAANRTDAQNNYTGTLGAIGNIGGVAKGIKDAFGTQQEDEEAKKKKADYLFNGGT